MHRKASYLFLGPIAATVLAFGGSTGAKAEGYDYIRDYLGWQIEKAMAAQHIVGMSIALVDGSNIPWAAGFGLADKAAGTPASADTVYRTSALSGLLTATAAMQLVEAGKLELDRPVTDYVAEFSPINRFQDTRSITPRLLLTHHSGLPLMREQGMWSDQPRFFTDLAAELSDDYLAFPPGDLLAYSASGYAVLGHAMQNASGEHFAGLLEQNLLQPAGMANAEFTAYLPKGPNAALPYKKGGNKAQREYPLRDVPAVGLNASVMDLAKFSRLLFDGGWAGTEPLLSAAGIEEMWRAQNADVPLDVDSRIGLGWFHDSAPGIGTVFKHAGGTEHYRAYLGMIPGEKLAVVMLANTDSAFEPMLRIADEALQLMWEAKTGREFPQPKALADLPVPPEYRTELDGFAAHFDTRYGFAKVRREGENLKVDLNGQALELKPKGDGRFAVRGRILGVIPADLKEVQLALHHVDGHDLLLARDKEGAFEVIGERLKPLPISGAWRERLGRYEIENAEGRLRDWAEKAEILTLERDGFLLAEIRHDGKLEQTLVLEALSDERAAVRGIVPGRGGVVQVVDGPDGERIVYSGLRLRLAE